MGRPIPDYSAQGKTFCRMAGVKTARRTVKRLAFFICGLDEYPVDHAGINKEVEWIICLELLRC
jgi:hypothetical protein